MTVVWTLLDRLVVRTTGMPFEVLDDLRLPETTAALDRLRRLERAVEDHREALLRVHFPAVVRALPPDAASARRTVSRQRSAVGRGRPVTMPQGLACGPAAKAGGAIAEQDDGLAARAGRPGGGAGGAARADDVPPAGDVRPGDDVPPAGDVRPGDAVPPAGDVPRPEAGGGSAADDLAAGLALWNDMLRRRDAAAERAARCHAAELAACADRLRDRAADPDVREAVRMLSPDFHAALRRWAEASAPGAGGREARRVERRLATYLQRLAAKNETNGRFGPIGYGRLAPEASEPLVVRTDERPVTTEVFATARLAGAVAAAIQADERMRRYLRPRRSVGHVFAADRATSTVSGRTLRLSPADARLAALCDGDATCGRLADRLGEPWQHTADRVAALLRRGLLVAAPLFPPDTPYPLAAVATALAALPSPRVTREDGAVTPGGPKAGYAAASDDGTPARGRHADEIPGAAPSGPRAGGGADAALAASREAGGGASGAEVARTVARDAAHDQPPTSPAFPRDAASRTSAPLAVPAAVPGSRPAAAASADPADPDADAEAAAALHAWQEIVAELRELVAASGVAAGDAGERARSRLAARYEALSGQSARRGAGRAYADRTLVFEEARGPLRRFDLGAAPTRAAGEGLPPVLAVWRAAALLRRCDQQRQARELMRSLGADRLPLLAYLRAAAGAGELAARNAVPALASLDEALCALIAGHEDESRVDVSAADLAAVTSAALESAARRDPWGAALPSFSSVDLLLMAPGATGAGPALVVGEGHAPALLSVFPTDHFRRVDEGGDPVADLLRRTWAEHGLRVAQVVIGRDTKIFPYRVGDPLVELRPHLPRAALAVPAAELQVRITPDGCLLHDAAGPLLLHPQLRRAAGFDPLAPLTVPAVEDHPVPLERHSPRLTTGGVVWQRERWRIGGLPWDAALSGFGLLRAARDWRARTRMPECVYYRVPEEPKPLLLDFASQHLVEVFHRHVSRSAGPVTLSEMLPGPADLWLRSAAGRHTFELRMLAVHDGSRGPDAGWRVHRAADAERPAPGAADGQRPAPGAGAADRLVLADRGPDG